MVLTLAYGAILRGIYASRRHLMSLYGFFMEDRFKGCKGFKGFREAPPLNPLNLCLPQHRGLQLYRDRAIADGIRRLSRQERLAVFENQREVLLHHRDARHTGVGHRW